MKTKVKMNMKTKAKMNMKTKKQLRTKLNNTKIKGGNFLNTISNSVFKNTKKKDYHVHVPGSNFVKSLTSTISNTKQTNILNVIFERNSPKPIDITNISSSTLVSSISTEKEPYISVNSMDKYLIAIYREKNKKNNPTPIFLLHFLVGYINRTPTKLFHYISPKLKPGKKQKFILNLYKYPINDKTKIFTKINNVNKKLAYQEFNTYINTVKIPVIKQIIYIINGELGSSINLFNMLK